jgi:hypothetical protein
MGDKSIKETSLNTLLQQHDAAFKLIRKDIISYLEGQGYTSQTFNLEVGILKEIDKGDPGLISIGVNFQNKIPLSRLDKTKHRLFIEQNIVDMRLPASVSSNVAIFINNAQ